MSNTKSCVYVLSDPRLTGIQSVKFIGCSRKSPKQLVAFVPFLARAHAMGEWRKSLHDTGLAPALTILEWAGDDWQARLEHWTGVYKKDGASLFANKFADPGYVKPAADAKLAAANERIAELEAKCIAAGVRL